MPWEQTSAMDQRVQFIADWLSRDYSKMDLCRAFGISRPTADKWIQRYQQGGVEQLEERSHAAHCHPNQTSEEIVQMLIDTKLYQQSWGPKKVLDYLRQNGPELAWPADSTAGEILKRAGLVKRRVRHHHVSPYSEPFGDCQGPNQIWSADFKGDFALGNHRRCYPLTISDNFSRYLLLCRALEHPSYAAVRPWLEWAFREYGLPEAIRTDNGAPFASLAIGGVSELSKWWIQLGIRPERIKPGKPSQNGRHERMHRTLKHDVPPQPTHRRQQNRFDLFLEQYNGQRSHEALERKTPASLNFSPE
jgi:transposase InsO family protein